MHTLGEMAKALHRSPVYLTGLQTRFELPSFEGPRYSSAYLALLLTLVQLRTLNIAEDTLRDLWHIEKKLLQLLHVDSVGSPTWHLDFCGLKKHSKRRLLLTNHDLGTEVREKKLQPGLNFSETPPELFVGKEMGEDALRVLHEYRKLHSRIQADVETELPNLKAVVRWASHV